MKSIIEYINENKGNDIWLTNGDGNIEICVPKKVFDRGITIHDIKKQMEKYSDKLIYNDIKEYGDAPKFDDFKDRDDLLEYFLFVHADEWEEDN